MSLTDGYKQYQKIQVRPDNNAFDGVLQYEFVAGKGRVVNLKQSAFTIRSTWKDYDSATPSNVLPLEVPNAAHATVRPCQGWQSTMFTAIRVYADDVLLEESINPAVSDIIATYATNTRDYFEAEGSAFGHFNLDDSAAGGLTADQIPRSIKMRESIVGRDEVESIYRPPLGIMDAATDVAGVRWRFEFTVDPNYRKRVGWWTAGATTSLADVNTKLNDNDPATALFDVKSMEMYVVVMTPDEKVSTAKREIAFTAARSIFASVVENGDNHTFNVPPSSYKAFFALQQADRLNLTAAGIAIETTDFDHLNLSTIRIQHDGLVQPNPDYAADFVNKVKLGRIFGDYVNVSRGSPAMITGGALKQFEWERNPMYGFHLVKAEDSDAKDIDVDLTIGATGGGKLWCTVFYGKMVGIKYAADGKVERVAVEDA